MVGVDVFIEMVPFWENMLIFISQLSWVVDPILYTGFYTSQVVFWISLMTTTIGVQGLLETHFLESLW